MGAAFRARGREDTEAERHEEVGRSLKVKQSYFWSLGRYREAWKVNTGLERLIGYGFQSKLCVCFICREKVVIFKVSVFKAIRR